MRLRSWGGLPERYAGRRVAASTIDAAGRIVALLVAPDVTYASEPYSATAVVIDGGTIVAEVVIPELDQRFSKIDVLDDGFVLAAARCAMPSGPAAGTVAELEAQIPRNACIVDSDGAITTRFHAGDGIEQLMVDSARNIWISYFDEASICAGDGPRILRHMPGLIRWTATGNAAWYAVEDGNGPSSWVDCYALNAGGNRTWAYPYMGFPLVEIDRAGVRCVRRTPVRSASGVVVADSRVAFIAGQGHGPANAGNYVVTFAHYADGPVEATSTATLTLPTGRKPTAWARHRACRDNHMWVQFGDDPTWYVFTL